ncbi:MAG: serine/threonine-protein kinase, partial [Polyangiaceae bacterium]
RVLDFGVDETDGDPFMVMELLRGEDLESLILRSTPIDPDPALRIAAQICVALDRAHQAHVVHRDIKPANIFLAEAGGELIVKILDFGIAKLMTDPADETEATRLTRTGALIGSPRYMSPEQAQGLKDIDERTDLWSLGLVMYELLTGRTPYRGLETVGQLIAAIVKSAPPPAQQFAPWLTPEVASIVERLLRVDPKERFPSAKAVLEAIRPLLRDGTSIEQSMLLPASQRMEVAASVSIAPPPMSVRIFPPSETGSSGDFVGELATTLSQSSVDRPPSKRTSFIAAGVGLLVVLLAGGFALYLLFS